MSNIVITRSVGRNGANTKDDVYKIRGLLNRIDFAQGGPNPKLKDGLPDGKLYEAIERFQKFHFGWATGRAEPDEATIHHMNLILSGQIPSQAASNPYGAAFAEHYRAEIVRIAGVEADREDRVTGTSKVNANSKQTPKGAARLKEYFKVFPAAAAWDPAEFLKGTPGGKAWCGIFATWVLSKVFKNMFFRGGDVDPGIFRDGKKLKTRKDRKYVTGDVCLTTEDGVVEPWPTHHFIVAGPPEKGIIPTIEGNFWDRSSGLIHAVVRNRRAAVDYAYMPVMEGDRL